MCAFLRSFAVLPLGACLAVLSAPAQSGSFIVAQHGKPVGTADFNFAAGPPATDSTSMVRLAMQGLDYALSKTESPLLGQPPAPRAVERHRQQHAVNVTAAPDAAQLLLNISANGQSTTARLAPHPGAVFLPDFDPGALETLLALAVAQNNRDLWAIIPKQVHQAGSISPILLATYADEQGTLDGKPIVVHHLVATIAGAVKPTSSPAPKTSFSRPNSPSRALRWSARALS